MELALTFDDVLMKPKYSSVKSRKDVDTSTNLTKDIKLNIPILASNMDTVCESDMAIKMAQLGGIGIIHRYLSRMEQVLEVSKVKNQNEVIIKEPYYVRVGTPTERAIDLMVEKNISSLMVLGEYKSLEGMLALKDLTFHDIKGTLVEDFMIPRHELVSGQMYMTYDEIKELMKETKVGKIPILDNEGDLCGLVTRKDLFKQDNYPLATRDSQGRLRVGAAVGVNGDYLDRVESLEKIGVDVIVVDIAHGHSLNCIEAVRSIKAITSLPVIAGNVATAQGALDLIEAGADGIKVGVGPGSICTTRIVTGHGVPQLSAIIDVCKVSSVPVIADGGIRKSGDMVKAIAAGASSVMLGSMLAGTEEAPGDFIYKDGSRCKMIRGMASFGAALGRKKRAGDDVSDAVPEGVEGFVPYRGYTSEVLNNMLGGFRSGMSYSGATNLEELWDNAEFMRISVAGLVESRHHDINKQ